MLYSDILLEMEQKELLVAMVEAARNVPRDQRRQFLTSMGISSSNRTMIHAGLPGGRQEAFPGDLEVLARAGLLTEKSGDRTSRIYDVTPEGYQYYKEMKGAEGLVTEKVENHISAYLHADDFKGRFFRAHEKLVKADSMLWESDSEKQLTTIGHLCREALQEFATELIDTLNPPNAAPNPAHTVARVRSVLDSLGTDVGEKETSFLKALLQYWGTVSDLVQRQEHGALKEGDELKWEDARRAVFQTALVMYEVGRTTSRL